MGRRASNRVKAVNLERIFQSLKDFTGLTPDSIYQRGEKISISLTHLDFPHEWGEPLKKRKESGMFQPLKTICHYVKINYGLRYFLSRMKYCPE
jgi:hypothetical protein